jgi:predicted dinucleotide-binding enzyme
MRRHSGLAFRGDPDREEIDMTPTAGILGAGTVGKAVARFFLTAGGNVIISNSRGPDSLGEVISELGTGAAAGTSAQAAQAPLVVLATPWTAVESTLAALPPWSGNTLVDATNAIKLYDPPRVELFDFGDSTSSEVVASLAPGASVIKAFNHISFARLLSPVPDGEQHALFVSGDDTAAKAGLRSVLEANNFAVIDLGDLATGSRIQQVGGPLGGLDLRLSAAG